MPTFHIIASHLMSAAIYDVQASRHRNIVLHVEHPGIFEHGLNWVYESGIVLEDGRDTFAVPA